MCNAALAVPDIHCCSIFWLILNEAQLRGRAAPGKMLLELDTAQGTQCGVARTALSPCCLNAGLSTMLKSSGSIAVHSCASFLSRLAWAASLLALQWCDSRLCAGLVTLNNSGPGMHVQVNLN